MSWTPEVVLDESGHLIAPHFDPCGAIVDYMRTVYSAPCRWYPGGPVGRIRWYVVPLTNKQLDGPHAFFPWTQYRDHANTEGVGEITTGKKRWRQLPGPVPGGDGSAPCGSPEDFAGQGVSPLPGGFVRESDLCPCSYPGTWRFTSGQGLEIGGSADVRTGGTYVSGRGLEIGGSAHIRTTARATLGRGLEAGGSATVSGGGVPGAGLEAGGSAHIRTTARATLGRGLEAGGSAAVAGGGPGGILTDCCGATPVPLELTLTIGGTCPCAVGVHTLTWDAVSERWSTPEFTECGLTQRYQFYCDALTLEWVMMDERHFGSLGALATTCSPFLWETTWVPGFGPCAGLTLELTVSE